jgi:hypothetical protein
MIGSPSNNVLPFPKRMPSLLPSAESMSAEWWKAALARTEQVVEMLSTRHVCDGWLLDRPAAARTLQYFRRLAIGGPENETEDRTANAFFSNHGQSFDRIFYGNPLSMICEAAGHSPRAQRTGRVSAT